MHIQPHEWIWSSLLKGRQNNNNNKNKTKKNTKDREDNGTEENNLIRKNFYVFRIKRFTASRDIFKIRDAF